MNGFLLINKPRQSSSFDVLRELRRLTGERRQGHAGTLDPLATGLLIVALGQGTRLLRYLSGLDKTYIASIKLGASTATDDAEGEEIPGSDLVPPQGTIEELLRTHFTGQISQIPPAYSAVHVDGQRAYARARAGQTVTLSARTVTIQRCQLRHYVYPYLELEIDCSSGTYIRSLARDLGVALGTGAYLSGLIRTRVANYTLEQAHELSALNNNNVQEKLLPINKFPLPLPTYSPTPEELRRLLLGQRLVAPPTLSAGHYDLILPTGRLIIRVEQDRIAPETVIN